MKIQFLEIDDEGEQTVHHEIAGATGFYFGDDGLTVTMPSGRTHHFSHDHVNPGWNGVPDSVNAVSIDVE